ncbi:MAG: hypothetical protein ACOY4F_02325 [Thermodesulfobacteriota bacterium]
MNETELIEALRKEAPKLGMSEEQFFAVAKDVLEQIQRVDLAEMTNDFLDQRERIAAKHSEMAGKIARRARKTDGTLEFPL